MEYIEINAHTAERVVHDDGSLLNRLKAIGLVKPNVTEIPKLPIDSQHAWFRVCHEDTSRMRHALPTGAWGLTPTIPCGVCQGSGKIVLKDAISSETVFCWNCGGTGKWKL